MLSLHACASVLSTMTRYHLVDGRLVVTEGERPAAWDGPATLVR